VVVDIGAYVGTFSVMAAAAGVVKVTAYEPSPRQFEILKLNAAEWNNIVPIQAAIVGTKERSEVSFYPGRHGVADSIIASRQRNIPVLVPAMDYCTATRSATVVKMDIEGGEYFIDDFVSSRNLRALIVDFHRKPRWDLHMRDVNRKMIKAGFNLILIPNPGAPVTTAAVWMRS